MTRLGYLVPEWPAQTHAFFAREVAALRALGNEVALFSTRRPPADACRHEFAARARAETHYVYPPRPGVALASLAKRPAKIRAALGYLASLSDQSLRSRARAAGLLLCAADLIALAEQLQLAHVHVHSCADAAHLAALARLLGGPSFSLTLHGDLPVYGSDHALKMKYASFVATVTRALRRQVIAEAGVPETRAPVITMGVDTDSFAPSARPPAAGDRLLLATVARLNPAKGHGYVLEAMARLRAQGLDVRYAIAGEGPHRQAIEERIAALGLAPWVELLGTVGEREVRALLQRADAFVLASEGLGEAAPVSVMEAMASGLPVLASRIGGTPDMIDDGRDGILVPQRDVAALAHGIARIARDLAYRAALGQAARERALKEFDFRAQAEKLHATIGAALCERPTTAHAGSRAQTY